MGDSIEGCSEWWRDWDDAERGLRRVEEGNLFLTGRGLIKRTGQVAKSPQGNLVEIVNSGSLEVSTDLGIYIDRVVPGRDSESELRGSNI